MLTIETVLSVDPDAVDRARRLDHACILLRAGSSPTEARRLIRGRYGVSVATAWRIVEMALDMMMEDRRDR